MTVLVREFIVTTYAIDIFEHPKIMQLSWCVVFEFFAFGVGLRFGFGFVFVFGGDRCGSSLPLLGNGDMCIPGNSITSVICSMPRYTPNPGNSLYRLGYSVPTYPGVEVKPGWGVNWFP